MDVHLKIAAIEFLFSSDSSDDEDTQINARAICQIPKKVPRIRAFITQVVEQYDDKEFKSRFRISRETCNFLIDAFKECKYCPSESKIRGRKVTTATEHILCFLWFAGNKCVIRTIADLFDVSLSTAYFIINRVINFFYDLSSTIIKFPQTAEERNVCATKFKEICGISGIVGCIDGTYIPIRTPCHKIKSTYVNRHHQTAITLQGICDAQNMFIDVFTGISSKIHDARVYKMSFIREKVCQMGNDYHIIGDAAYPLSINLITPYKDYGTLNETERTFNKAFCTARVKIENIYGYLKNRFRQLIRLEMWSVIKMSKFIVACCVLHNLCIIKNDHFENYLREYMEIYHEPNEYILYSSEERNLGKQKRDTLATTYMESLEHVAII